MKTGTLIRSERFEEYILKIWSRAFTHQRMFVQNILGTKLNNLKIKLPSMNLDKKLQILTTLNYRFMLIVFDNEAEKVKYADIEKLFDYYISEERNTASNAVKEKFDIFVMNEMQAAKHLFAGGVRFAEPLYKMAQDGTQFQFLSEVKTPTLSISKSEQNERNMKVYGMMFDLIEKGYNLDEYLQAFNMDFGHFQILARLFRSSTVLTKTQLLKKHGLIFKVKSSPTTHRLKYLIEQGMVEAYSLYKNQDRDTQIPDEQKTYDTAELEGMDEVSDEQLQNEEDKKERINLYHLRPHGVSTYIEIVNKLALPTAYE